MPSLNERIIKELQRTEVKNLSHLINYMNGEKGFFWRSTRDRYVDSPVKEIVNARVPNPVSGNERNERKRHDKGYWKHSAV